MLSKRVLARRAPHPQGFLGWEMEKGAWERQEPGRTEAGAPSGPILTPRLKVRALEFLSLGLNALGQI